jgi:hypothetical protein
MVKTTTLLATMMATSKNVNTIRSFFMLHLRLLSWGIIKDKRYPMVLFIPLLDFMEGICVIVLLGFKETLKVESVLSVHS